MKYRTTKTIKGISLVYIKYCLIRFEINKENINKYLDVLHINKKQLKFLIKSGVLDQMYGEIGDAIKRHNLIAKKIERLNLKMQEIKQITNQETPNNNRRTNDEKISLISRLIRERQLQLLSLEVSKNLKDIGANCENNNLF